jgi:hypothetical protein
MSNTQGGAVSLQGTFDVFSLPELLRMLAASSKSGALIIEAGGVAGRVDLRAGECLAAETVELRGAVSGDELHARLVDVCFAVVREPTGAFRFAAGEPPAFESDTTISVDPVLDEVELLVAEWRELTTRIPSLDLRPVLVAELASESITLSANEWMLLARFDGFTSVRDLVDARRRSLVDVCRAVADLVDRGAVTLVDGAPAVPHSDATANANGDGGARADDLYAGGRVTPVAPYGPGIDEAVESELAASAATDAASAAVDAESDGGVDVVAHAPVGDVADPAQATMGVASDDATPLEPADPAVALSANGSVSPEALLALAGDGADDGDRSDRGAILRLFSALREG